jgi:hypothetical protein
MTQLLNNVEAEFAATEIRTSLIGRKCWYGYISFGNTFQIALGKRIARDSAEVAATERLQKIKIAKGRKPRTLDEFDRFMGESNLLVWCSWRLDGEKGPMTSWDDETGRCVTGIRSLIGRTVRDAVISDRWNLQLAFTGGWTLNVFPDHVGKKASFDGNWEIWQPRQAYFIGTDLMCEVMDRQERHLRLQPQQGRWRVQTDKLRK